MSDASHLGRFIRECRQNLKYTSREVARLSTARHDLPSISNSYLISVENGKHIPRLDKVIALAELLNVPVVQLVDSCRRDIGVVEPPVSEADFSSLVEAGQEQAEGSDHAGALRLFRQAYEVALKGNGAISAVDRCEVRLQIANCYRRLKINRVAKEELEGLLKEMDLPALLRARAAFALADIYREEKSVFLGTIVAREALTIAHAAGDEVLEGKILSALGNLAAEQDRHDEALSLYREAATKLHGAGHVRAARIARIKQGLILVEKRDYYRAIELLRGELSAVKERDPFVRGWLHVGLAKAYYRAENLKSSRTHARSGRDCADELRTVDLQFLAIYYLWLGARAEGADTETRTLYQRLKQLRNKLDVDFDEIVHFDRQRRLIETEGALQ